MKALSNVTKISIVVIICFFITVTSCKNNDIDNSPEQVSMRMAKDDNFQSFKMSINIIRPVLMGNFLRAKSNEEMQLYATKIAKVLSGNNSEIEINELSKTALLNEKQIIIFKEHLVNIKKRQLILMEEYGTDITKEVIKRAYEVKVPQSTKVLDDCVLCIAGNCIYCPGASRGIGGDNTVTYGGDISGNNNSTCRNLVGYQNCTRMVAEDYAWELAAWTLTIVLTEGVSAPAAIIAIALAQAKAQTKILRCNMEFCQ